VKVSASGGKGGRRWVVRGNVGEIARDYYEENGLEPGLGRGGVGQL